MQATPKGPQVNLKVLEAVKTGLEEIENGFEWAGFSAHEAQQTEAKDASEETDSTDEGSDDEENDDDFDRPTFLSCEDIEVAVDEFLSVLIRRKLIRENKSSKQPPSFSMALEQIFGKDHDIMERADSFEENTKCYFDTISYERMEQAHLDFLEIQRIIQTEVTKCSSLKIKND